MECDFFRNTSLFTQKAVVLAPRGIVYLWWDDKKQNLTIMRIQKHVLFFHAVGQTHKLWSDFLGVFIGKLYTN